jgi:hypothetical protein
MDASVVAEKVKVEACQDAVFTSAQIPEGHAGITIGSSFPISPVINRSVPRSRQSGSLSLYAEQTEVHCMPFLDRDHVVQPRPCG